MSTLITFGEMNMARIKKNFLVIYLKVLDPIFFSANIKKPLRAV